ncbi:ABC transporter ATP-binding protein [Cryptosporangium japonicum]|uniref:Linearmycin resistance ATP-binding protein LnrL n=1 Tax=Cryptosporangium japonicum TaxID=80872 RepID=A0ABP3D490_9ACTN
MTSSDVVTEEADAERVAPPVLRCRDLRKSFEGTAAVNGLSFTIAPGETYGLLGPNGAGKSTTILMVAGVLAADAGQIDVGGRAMTVRSVRAKRAIGYVPQETALYPELSGRENLRFFAGLYGLGRAEGRARVEDVLDIVGLADKASATVKTYSGGMQRRLNIAVGLLHQPELLILDEPTVGVDPQSRNAILESIEALSAAGMAVLYTTHYMEEAERLCDRVGIIDRGALVAEGTTRELTGLVGEADHVRLDATGDLAAAAEALRGLPTTRTVTVGPDGLDILDADARTALPDLLAVAAGAGAVVRSVAVEEPDLEAVFLHLTGSRLRD